MIPSSLKRCTWYDIFRSQGESRSLIFRNSRFFTLRESQRGGFGIRVNLDGRTGFSYDTGEDSLEDTAARALEMAPFGEEEDFILPGSLPQGTLHEPRDPAIDEYSEKEVMEEAQQCIDEIKSSFKDASVDLGVTVSRGRQELENSEGLVTGYRSSFFSASLSVTLVDRDGGRVDVSDSFSDLFPRELKTLMPHVLDRLRRSATGSRLESGTYPVILTPRAFAQVLSILVSGLNGRSIERGVSPFTGRLGEDVFAGELGLVDRPVMEGSPFSRPTDDEGLPARDTWLVREGKIENYLLDLRSASRLMMEPTGNASRSNGSLPSPATTNLVVTPGPLALDELVTSTEKGLVVDQFIGLGQSNTLTGDFSASLDLAFLVENGEMKGRLKDTMVHGNLYEMLRKNMTLASDPQWRGSWFLPGARLEGLSLSS